ncbi:MAG: cytochrome c [Anaerolineales bacterium]|nr:cytochrome c [Anaerolineales bacterium]MCB8950698.1 cytochrome c [Ardenticatenales bacterium]
MSPAPRHASLMRGWFCLLTLFLAACGGAAAQPTPTPTRDPIVVHGETVFNLHCATCHATAPDTIIVGPSLAGVAERAGTRDANLTAKQYIEISILRPDAYLVAGFPNAMPADLGKKLTSEELDAVVTFLLTLK